MKKHIVEDLSTTRRKYDIIYADPAWRFSDTKTGGNHKSGASQKYLTMSFQEIYDLPVKRITKENAILFLWIPDSMLIEGLKVFEAWGFKYNKKAFTWIKKTKHGKDYFGMGRSTRNGCEDLYLGIKGKPEFISKSIRQVQYSIIEEHSRKPEKFRKLIIDLCGKKKRIELFARRSCCGFDVWGNESR